MVLHCCVAAFSVASRHLVCCGTPLLLRGVMLLWCLCGVLVALCVLWYSIAASQRLVCCGTPLLHRGVCASRRGGAGRGTPFIVVHLVVHGLLHFYVILLWCLGGSYCAVVLHCCIAPFCVLCYSIAASRYVCVAAGRGGPFFIHCGSLGGPFWLLHFM